jgi:hypothetical protein
MRIDHRGARFPTVRRDLVGDGVERALMASGQEHGRVFGCEPAGDDAADRSRRSVDDGNLVL